MSVLYNLDKATFRALSFSCVNGLCSRVMMEVLFCLVRVGEGVRGKGARKLETNPVNYSVFNVHIARYLQQYI